jgi:hypothetical protein
VDIPRVEGAGIPPAAAVVDTPAVAAIPVEAIAKRRQNKLL